MNGPTLDITVEKKLKEIGRIPPAWIFYLLCYYALRLFGVRRESWENKLRFYLHLIACDGRIIRDNVSHLTCQYVILGRKLIVHLRNYPSSDPRVVEQILVSQQYRSVAEVLSERNARFVMIDAGANIGLASVYFKTFFENLEVIAIEPDPGNYQLMKLNLEANDISTARCLHAALWKDSATLSIRSDFRDGKAWSIAVGESGSNSADVSGVTLAELFRGFALERVDLLKIDIEGSEKHVFSDSDAMARVLKNVGCLAIEIHDEVCDRAAIERQIAEVYKSIIRSGELTVGFGHPASRHHSIGGS